MQNYQFSRLEFDAFPKRNKQFLLLLHDDVEIRIDREIVR
jgi:hypothetical protein